MRDDGRRTGCKGLVDTETPLVEFTGEHDEIRQRVEPRHMRVRHRTQNEYMFGQPEPVDLLQQLSFAWTLPYQHERDAAQVQSRVKECANQQVDILARHEAAYA